MAAFNYARLGTRSTAMLKRFGQALTLKRIARAFNAVSGATTTSAQSGPVWLVRMDEQEMLREFGAIELAEGSQGSWMSNTAGFTPAEQDTLLIDGVTWKIDKVQPLAPGGVTLLYKVILVQ